MTSYGHTTDTDVISHARLYKWIYSYELGILKYSHKITEADQAFQRSQEL